MPKEHARSVGFVGDLIGGIMNFVSELKLVDSFWFLFLWLLVLSHPGSNLGFELDSGSLGLSSWDPSPSGLLGFWYVGLVLHGFRGSTFGSSLWGLGFYWLGGLRAIDSSLCGPGPIGQHGSGSFGFGSCGLTWWFGWSKLLCVVFLV